MSSNTTWKPKDGDNIVRLLPPEGDEWKAFHAADGLGLRLLMEAVV